MTLLLEIFGIGNDPIFKQNSVLGGGFVGTTRREGTAHDPSAPPISKRPLACPQQLGATTMDSIHCYVAQQENYKLPPSQLGHWAPRSLVGVWVAQGRPWPSLGRGTTSPLWCKILDRATINPLCPRCAATPGLVGASSSATKACGPAAKSVGLGGR